MITLSTSTNIVCERPGGLNYTLEKTLEVAGRAGFDTFDISFYDWSLPFSPFITDKWEAWIHGAAKKADALGVKFGQCHAYTYDFLNPAYTDEERAHHEELVRRSLKCCQIAGSRLCVTHPDTAWHAQKPMEASRRMNAEYFKPLLEYAAGLGMDLALENMCDYSSLPNRGFFVMPEDIVDFIDTFADSRLGVCWDFEHADILELDQVKALELIGNRLKATHASDTLSKTFEPLMHVLPLFGFIDWKAIMDTLRKIGYRGALCLEAHNFAKRLPEELIPTAMKLAFEIGRYLLSL